MSYRIIFIVLALVFCGAYVSFAYFGTYSAVSETNAYTKVPELEPQPPELDVSAWGIFDTRSGEVIVGKNIDTSLPIASVAKLFTAFAVDANDTLDENISISWQDVSTEGRAGKLSYGDTYTARELLFPLLLESSNDAGEALKRALGSDFDRALLTLNEETGLTSTRIVDGSGLSTMNVSSVSDLARFLTYLSRTNPYPLSITKLPMYLEDGIGWVNNNPARELPGFLGGKHGYTDAAGKTYVGLFEVNEDTRPIGVVLLGSHNLLSDLHTILSFATERTK